MRRRIDGAANIVQPQRRQQVLGRLDRSDDGRRSPRRRARVPGEAGERQAGAPATSSPDRSRNNLSDASLSFR